VTHVLVCILKELDETWLHTAATALVSIQNLCGKIPNVYAVGQCAEVSACIDDRWAYSVGKSTESQCKNCVSLLPSADRVFTNL